MKVKVTKEIKELEGNLVEKVATPFGTSAHINVGKKHTGKVMSYVVPEIPEYEWVLSENDLKKTQSICKKLLKDKEGKLVQVERNLIAELSGRFNVESLYAIERWLKETSKGKVLLRKIKKTYDF